MSKINPEAIIEDLTSYPGPDGRGLFNVHWHGRIVGYSNGGHRDRVHRIVGTNIASPYPYMHGMTKSTDEMPCHELEIEKRNFREWVDQRPWFVRGMRVDVIDDTCMGRIEYRIYW
jgi:hypothetical protein